MNADHGEHRSISGHLGVYQHARRRSSIEVYVAYSSRQMWYDGSPSHLEGKAQLVLPSDFPTYAHHTIFLGRYRHINDHGGAI